MTEGKHYHRAAVLVLTNMKEAWQHRGLDRRGPGHSRKAGIVLLISASCSVDPKHFVISKAKFVLRVEGVVSVSFI